MESQSVGNIPQNNYYNNVIWDMRPGRKPVFILPKFF